MSSFSSLPGLKYGTFFGGTSTLSPVFGLRPLRGSRRRSRKLPNPRSSIFSPRWSASMMLLKTVSTMTSECFFVRSETRETSSTSSAFVMLPVFMVAPVGRSRPVASCQFPVASCQCKKPVAGRKTWKPATGNWLLLVLEVIAQRHFRTPARLRVRLPVGAELVALERPDAQADLPLGRNQLDDLHLVRLADLEIQLAVLALLVRVVELGHVDQPFDAFRQLDERAEVGHADDLALDRVADVVVLEELVPDVGLELLEAQRQPLVFGVDVEHHRVDGVALLERFRRMLQALAPRHVGDVDQAVDTVLDLDEGAELGEVAHLAGDRRADRVLLGELVPRVALDLLQAERDPPRAGIDAEDHRFDRVADVEDLRRMLHALAPRHLADVDEPLDARLELDEPPVVGQAHDLARQARAHGIALDHVGPRIVHQLLVAQRDALGRRVVLQDDHVDFLIDLEELRRMRHAAPRHVGDVQQAVDAAEIDERAVVGDVLDDAAQDLALGERVERVLLLLGVLLFEEHL